MSIASSISNQLFKALDALARSPKAFPAAAGALTLLRRVLWYLLGPEGAALITPTMPPAALAAARKAADDLVQGWAQQAEILLSVVGATTALQSSTDASSAALQLVASELSMALRCFTVGQATEAVTATLKVIIGGVKSFLTMSIDKTLLSGLGTGADLAVRICCPRLSRSSDLGLT